MRKKNREMEVVLCSASRLVANRLLDMLRKPVSPSMGVPRLPFLSRAMPHPRTIFHQFSLSKGHVRETKGWICESLCRGSAHVGEGWGAMGEVRACADGSAHAVEGGMG